MDSTELETSIEKRFDIKPVDGAHHLVRFTRYNVAVNAKVRLGQDTFPLCVPENSLAHPSLFSSEVQP